MTETLDLEGRWPELFAPLDDDQRRAVVQAFAASWHEGWTPNYEDVKKLVDEARGLIDEDEYVRRTIAAASRNRAGE